MRTFENSINRYVLLDDGIVVVHEINPEIERSAELVNGTFDDLERLIEGEPRPILWDLRPVLRFTALEWRQLLDRLEDFVTTLAIVVGEDTPGARSLFPTLAHLPYLRVRMFEDETEALRWLRREMDPDAASPWTDPNGSGSTEGRTLPR